MKVIEGNFSKGDDSSTAIYDCIEAFLSDLDKDQIEDVMLIARNKDGGLVCETNLTAAHQLFLIEATKHVIMSCCVAPA